MGRMTDNKSAILYAFKDGYHPTADELLMKLKKTYPDFSRSTLYRQLATLVEEGKLKKIGGVGQTDRYTNNLDCHYHLVCESCGRIEELNMPNAIKTPAKLMNYDVDYHELTFYGICPNCQKKAK